MNGRVAKRLRRETPQDKPKIYTKPFMAMLPEGPPGEDGKPQLVPVHIPRKARRLMIRKMMTDYKKGRTDANGRPTNGKRV